MEHKLPIRAVQDAPETTPVVPSTERGGFFEKLIKRDAKQVRPERSTLGASILTLITGDAAPAPKNTENIQDDVIDRADGSRHVARAALRVAMAETVEAPRRIFEDMVAARIATRIRRLEAKAPEAGAVSVLTAGLGVVAVLLAGRQYFARHAEEAPQMAVLPERPRLTWKREPETAVQIAIPEQAANVERTGTVERLPVRTVDTASAVPVAVPDEIPVAPNTTDATKPPLNPAALRREAERKAQAAKVAATTWFYVAIASAATLVGTLIFITRS